MKTGWAFYWLAEEKRNCYEDECRRLIQTKTGKTQLAHSHGATLLLLLHAGLRIGEALALAWDDYDEYCQTLSVTKIFLHNDSERKTDSYTQRSRQIGSF